METRTFLMATGLALLAACGASDPLPPPSGPAMVVIENESQYLLEELRFHGSSDYRSQPNALEGPLAVGATGVFYRSGTTFVTVFREKFRGGDLLALTTESPVALEGDRGYRVKVFDLSFRVLPETYVPPPTTTSTTGE